MPNNITRLLPSSFPTQNTHRHVVFNADTQPDELARVAILTADAIAAARAAVRAYEEDPILPESLGITFRALADLVRQRRVLDDDFREAAEEALEHLSRLRTDDPQIEQKIDHLRSSLGEAVARSHRVADLITAEHDIRRRRSLSARR